MSSNNDITNVAQALSLGKLVDFPLEVRQTIYKSVFEEQQLYLDHTYNEGHSQAVPHMKALDTSIFYVSRQISKEATKIMYEEVKVVVRAADIFGLQPQYQDLVEGSQGIWRFDPTMELEESREGGIHYNAQILNGDMYPHIFAKFQKVILDLRLNLVDDEPFSNQCPQLWIDFDNPSDINAKAHVDKDQQAEFITFVKGTQLFRNLVRVLENSHRITHLEIKLGIWHGFGHGHGDVLANNHVAEDIVYDVGDVKNLEALLKSGVYEELTVLTNVKSAKVIFYAGCSDETAAIERHMKRRYKRKARKLEELIVEGFTEPTDL